MSFFDGILQKVLGLAPRLKKRVFDPEAMCEDDIELPMAIKNYDKDLKGVIKNEIDTFRLLGYKDKDPEDLKVKEYHSLQIGIMLKYVKDGKYFPIDDIQNLLPPYVLSVVNKQLHIKIFDLVYRYDNLVDKTQTLDQLANQLEWTPLEAAYLLRYINMQNRKLIN